MVAKGFYQQEGVNYHDIFSPIVKPNIIWLVLTFAISCVSPSQWACVYESTTEIH